jgi:hypothetical protein
MSVPLPSGGGAVVELNVRRIQGDGARLRSHTSDFREIFVLETGAKLACARCPLRSGVTSAVREL